MRALACVMLMGCAGIAEPLDPGNRDRVYPTCALVGTDLVRENAAAHAEAAVLRGHHGMAFDALIVPGFTAHGEHVDGLHPYAKERLLRAVIDWRRHLAPFFILSGGAVTEGVDNEALAMKHYLVAGGIPEARIFIDPCARHSHTNLRNSGRLLLSNGLHRALIVTSYDQAFYFSTGWLTGFTSRCMKYLGYVVGMLERYDAQRVIFVPTARAFERGDDPLDP